MVGEVQPDRLGVVDRKGTPVLLLANADHIVAAREPA